MTSSISRARLFRALAVAVTFGCILAASSPSGAAPAAPVVPPREAPQPAPAAEAEAALWFDRVFGWFMRGDALLFSLQPERALQEYETGLGESGVAGAYAALHAAWAYSELGDFPKALKMLDTVLPGRYFGCGVGRQGVKSEVADLQAVWRVAVLPSGQAIPKLTQLTKTAAPRRARTAALALFTLHLRAERFTEAYRVLRQHQPPQEPSPSEEVRLLQAHYRAWFPAASHGDAPPAVPSSRKHVLRTDVMHRSSP